MKCKYCGAEIEKGLTCDLCGHRNIGQLTCDVCGTKIFPGQENCSNCGSPTVYRKLGNSDKVVTPDIITHSESSHNYNTVSESYDYKKEAYDYQEKKIPKIKNFNFNQIITKKGTKKNHIVAVLISVGVCVLTVVSTVYDTVNEAFFSNNDPISDTSAIEDINFTKENGFNSLSGNFVDDNKAALYGNNIYYCSDDGVYLFDSEVDTITKKYESYSCEGLYIDDYNIYLNDNHQYCSFDYNFDSKKVILENVSRVYHYQNELIYQDDENDQLFYRTVDGGDSLALSNGAIDEYAVDLVNRQVVYVLQGDSKVMCVNLDGTNERELNFDFYDRFMFKNGKLYYLDYEGIHIYDINGNSEIGLIKVEDIYQFIIGDDNVIITRDYDGLINKVNFNDNYEVESTDILFEDDSIRGFYFMGNNILCWGYDDDYNYQWYLVDENSRHVYLNNK